ncbi:MAG: NAD(P)/FAD-dependent oxidoreductase [Myxococcales bacterium]|nr:NAD(P)/FAD-dependent oxidoreductase [Myxococcales bacterium]
MALRLQQTGRRRFVIVEKADGVGGVWRNNRYPGCACDVPAHLYSLSFAPNPDWRRHFAPQPEILAYIERLADPVRPQLRLGVEVVSARFEADAAAWHLTFRDGNRLRARHLVLGLGGLHWPARPAIAGLDDFGGDCFHTAEWPDGFDPVGRRVAVIGTGASAIQVVPALAQKVAALDVYQRTPPWVMSRNDAAFGPMTRRAFAFVPGLRRLYRAATYARMELLGAPLTTRPDLPPLAQKPIRKHRPPQVPRPRAARAPDARLRARLQAHPAQR